MKLKSSTNRTVESIQEFRLPDDGNRQSTGADWMVNGRRNQEHHVTARTTNSVTVVAE
jgi:hypothetical protein